MLYRKKSCIHLICIFLTFSVFYNFLVMWGKLVGTGFPIIIHWPPVDQNIKCYDVIVDDALQSVDDPGFSPKSQSIFFHETSCRGGIDSRQACAVEAAARAHPDWEVYLLFTAPVSASMLKRSCLMTLLEFPNIRLARIHVESYSRGTDVQSIVSGSLRKSKHSVQHTEDIMKILTLHKWGGVTIDLDMLVMRSLNCSENWIAKESSSLCSLVSGIMSFSKDAVGHNLTENILREIASTYKPEIRSFNGASAIKRVLMQRCSEAAINAGSCQGIRIMGPEQFYPIDFPSAPLMLKKGLDPLNQVKQKPYTYCMWKDGTSLLTVEKDSAYVKIAKQVCPTIYKIFDDKFGV